MAILEVNNSKKIYSTRFGGNKVQALANVTFSVEKGEIHSHWASRVRKDNAFKHPCLADKPTSGEVLLGGRNIVNISEKEISAFRRDNLGFVFQDFNLLDTFRCRTTSFCPLCWPAKATKR